MTFRNIKIDDMCRRFTIPVVFILAFSFSGFAQTCCSGGVPLQGNIGMPASAKGTWQFALNYDYNFLNTFQSGRKKFDDKSQSRTTHSVLYQIGFAPTERLSFDAFFSFVRQERSVTRNGIEDFIGINGIGDAVVLAKYRLTSINSKRSLHLGVGPKIPLGSFDEGGRIDRPEPDLQPGSGAWDLVIWGSYIMPTGIRPSMSLSLTSIYRLTGKNDDFIDGLLPYEYGNEFQAVLSVSDRIAIKTVVVDPSLSFRFRTITQDKGFDVQRPNTGGDWIFIIPGISINISSRMAANFSFELPIFADIEGTQVVPTYRFNAGVFYVLPSKASREENQFKF